MTATLITSEASIIDSDLCLHKNQSNGQNIVEEIESEDEEIKEITVSLTERTIEDLEREKMLDLGLPIQFTSRCSSGKSKKRRNKKCFNKDSNDANESNCFDDSHELSFEKYWTESCYEILCETFHDKYPDLKLSIDEDIDEDERELRYNQLWNEHCDEYYSTAYSNFIEFNYENNSQVLPLLMSDMTVSEKSDLSDGLDNEKNNSSKSNKETVIIVNESLPTMFGSKSVGLSSDKHMDESGGEEPPDERPVVIKREHENDFIDFMEVNQSQDKNINNPNKKRKSKYWHQRYRLFSRFDEGIKLDNESWYSVTPERIAQHIAQRFSNNKDNYVIVDAFCGSGGNTIQFALISQCVRVIAIDIDPRKVEFAKNNASIYGVSDRIEFIVGDYMQLAKCCAFKADSVFLSPPWGGPKYLKQEEYKLAMMTPNGVNVFNAALNISPNIGFLLPRNIDKKELREMAGEGKSVEVEQNLLNNKVKTVTAYFGNLIKTD